MKSVQKIVWEMPREKNGLITFNFWLIFITKFTSVLILKWKSALTIIYAGLLSPQFVLFSFQIKYFSACPLSVPDFFHSY